MLRVDDEAGAQTRTACDEDDDSGEYLETSCDWQVTAPAPQPCGSCWRARPSSARRQREIASEDLGGADR